DVALRGPRARGRRALRAHLPRPPVEPGHPEPGTTARATRLGSLLAFEPPSSFDRASSADRLAEGRPALERLVAAALRARDLRAAGGARGARGRPAGP